MRGLPHLTGHLVAPPFHTTPPLPPSCKAISCCCAWFRGEGRMGLSRYHLGCRTSRGDEQPTYLGFMLYTSRRASVQSEQNCVRKQGYTVMCYVMTTGSVGAQGNQRRCLTNRAAAAAAGGHSGAQIAILKQAALGARISVWWPLDEHWYRCA